jgi:hypothetical protein
VLEHTPVRPRLCLCLQRCIPQQRCGTVFRPEHVVVLQHFAAEGGGGKVGEGHEEEGALVHFRRRRRAYADWNPVV